MVVTAVGGPRWFPARPAIIPSRFRIETPIKAASRAGSAAPISPSAGAGGLGLPGSGLSYSVYERCHRVAGTEGAFGLLVVILILVVIAAIVLAVLIIGRRWMHANTQR